MHVFDRLTMSNAVMDSLVIPSLLSQSSFDSSTVKFERFLEKFQLVSDVTLAYYLHVEGFIFHTVSCASWH